MRAEHFGTILARGIGLGLVLIGASDSLYAFPFAADASAGWTSSSALTNMSASSSSFVWSSLSVVLPCVAQLALGSAMLLLGKPIGRWLARGLKDEEAEK